MSGGRTYLIASALVFVVFLADIVAAKVQVLGPATPSERFRQVCLGPAAPRAS